MKIFIEVTTPGNGRNYELMLDDKLTVGAAKEKIIEQIVLFENDCIAFEEDVSLFAPTTCVRLPDYRNLRKAGVESGQSLILL
jgi:hypothetical protein